MIDVPVMLITGTRLGIGYHLAQHYCTRGYLVIGCSRQKSNLVNNNYLHVECDITDEISLRTLFSFIKKEYGRVDVLINNAGLSSSLFAVLAKREHINATFMTNVVGTMLVTGEVVKLMKSNSFGRIINLSTIHVPLATVGTSIYSSTKIAIEQYSRVVAKEVSTYGITINTIGLSYVNNSGMINDLNNATLIKLREIAAIDICIDMSDIVYSIDFFIDIKAHFITGQTLYTSGVWA